MIRIAVLIASHNRRAKTLECLRLLYAQLGNSRFALDVFLLDDASSDGTSTAISSSYPEVTLLQGDGCLFWNRGMNAAWEEALKIEPDFFLWLNDDTFLFPDAIVCALDAYSELMSPGVLVGATCDSNNRDFTTYGGRIGEEVLSPNGSLQKCILFNGNFVLIPDVVVKQVGILDVRFIHSFGDIEYGLRLEKAGVSTFMLPHHVGVCPRNVGLPSCFDPDRPLLFRLKQLYSPLGMNPFEFYYLRRMYYGVFSGLKTFLSLHVRVFFPELWL